MPEGSRPRLLDYSAAAPVRLRARWIGVIVTTAVAGGGISLLVSSSFRSVGLFPAERVAVYVVLLASAVCIVIGANRLRHERDTLGVNARRSFTISLTLAAILDIVALWSCLTAYSLH